MNESQMNIPMIICGIVIVAATILYTVFMIGKNIGESDGRINGQNMILEDIKKTISSKDTVHVFNSNKDGIGWQIDLSPTSCRKTINGLDDGPCFEDRQFRHDFCAKEVSDSAREAIDGGGSYYLLYGSKMKIKCAEEPSISSKLLINPAQ